MFIDFKKKYIYLRPSKTAPEAVMNFFKLPHYDNIFFNSGAFQISSSCCFVDNRDIDGREISKLALEKTKTSYLHYNYNRIKSLFSKEEDFNKYNLIISIRDPYHHAISYYKFQKTQILRRLDEKTNFRFFVYNPIRAFEQHLFFFQSKWSFYIFLKLFYKPYTPWLDPYFNGRQTIIIRCEHIEDDLKAVCKKYELSYSEVKHLNLSYDKKKSDLDTFYNKFSKKIIEKEYSQVLEEFGYSYLNQ